MVYHYHGDVDPKSLCHVCNEPMQYPVMCSDCWTQRCNDCPGDTCCAKMCNETLINGSGKIRKVLESLMCACPNDSCVWVGPRKDFPVHLKKCEDLISECIFECGTKIHMQNDMMHYYSCPGYRRYLSDVTHSDLAKMEMAMKIQHWMSLPLVLDEEHPELELPACPVRWKIPCRVVITGGSHQELQGDWVELKGEVLRIHLKLDFTQRKSSGSADLRPCERQKILTIENFRNRCAESTFRDTYYRGVDSYYYFSGKTKLVFPTLEAAKPPDECSSYTHKVLVYFDSWLE